MELNQLQSQYNPGVVFTSMLPVPGPLPGNPPPLRPAAQPAVWGGGVCATPALPRHSLEEKVIESQEETFLL